MPCLAQCSITGVDVKAVHIHVAVHTTYCLEVVRPHYWSHIPPGPITSHDSWHCHKVSLCSALGFSLMYLQLHNHLSYAI